MMMITNMHRNSIQATNKVSGSLKELKPSRTITMITSAAMMHLILPSEKVHFKIILIITECPWSMKICPLAIKKKQIEVNISKKIGIESSAVELPTTRINKMVINRVRQVHS